MRTEIMPAGDLPAMTAEHMRRAIMDVFAAYETNDRAKLEKWIAENFRITSPYDDAIDREAYFERCWPNHLALTRMKVSRIFIDGNAAYVTYLATAADGRSFSNTEFMTFSGGRIASVEVFFGAEYRDGRMLPKSSMPLN